MTEVLVGRPRPTNNPIINQREHIVGKSTAQIHAKPDDFTHTYGAPNKRDPETAAEVMLSWHEHQPRTRPVDYGRDFIALNKGAARARAATTAEVKQYRETHDYRVHSHTSKDKELLVQHTRSPSPSAGGNGNGNVGQQQGQRAFGRPSNECPCSVKDLMQNKFEMDWVMEQQHLEEKRRRKQARQEALRRASPLRVRATPSPAPPPAVFSPETRFTLKKFQDVPSKLAKAGLIARSPSPNSGAAAASAGGYGMDDSRRSQTPSLPPIGH